MHRTLHHLARRLLLTGPAHAQGDAYLRDTQGGYVHNSDFGEPRTGPRRIGNLCWRTGYWTPAQAVAACDADPVPVVINLPPPPPPEHRDPVTHKVTFSADLFFDFDRAVLKRDAKIKLDEVATRISTLNLEVVIIVGHTDGIGSDAYNNKLSVRRAEAVKAYLASKGLDPGRLYTEGKGKRAPIANNRTAQGRAKNRRVEIEVIGTRK
ncbi:MAG TPA: OmpA family protein [Burkholderiales bacterium]|jgi:OOP family OmpA-OmpF porin